MTIEARQLQTWIGTEVLDGAGEKLGKLEDVYFRDAVPLAVSVRSGLVGRKHHAAALRGASVSREHLHLDATADMMVATDGSGLGADHLTALAAHDDRLHGLEPAALEGWYAREERLKVQAEAQAAADKLETEAQLRAEDEDAAATRARDAEQDAEQARLAREEAEARALRAREDAGPPS